MRTEYYDEVSSSFAEACEHADVTRQSELAATSWLRGGAQPESDEERLATEMIMSKAENIYNIADNHARTLQVCIDRLHDLGANDQLKVLTERLKKLAARAIAEDDHEGSQIARRH